MKAKKKHQIFIHISIVVSKVCTVQTHSKMHFFLFNKYIFNGVETFGEHTAHPAGVATSTVAMTAAHTHMTNNDMLPCLFAQRDFSIQLRVFFSLLPVRLISHLFTFHFIRCQFVYFVQWAWLSYPSFARCVCVQTNKHIAFTNWHHRLGLCSIPFDERSSDW